MADQLRYGKVIHVDVHKNNGTILDENEQEIDFLLDGQSGAVLLNDSVSFIIQYIHHELKACHVAKTVHSL